MAKSEIKIYHNPACSTSRKVLGILRDAGSEPTVIEYLKTPPTRAELKTMLRDAGLSVRQILRKKGTPYEELGLDDVKWSDDQLLDFIMQHPILIERPLVVSDRGTRLCRPVERVQELLP